MKFSCHRQDCPGIGLTDGNCRSCGLKMTVRGVTGYYLKSVIAWLKVQFGVTCPKCRGLIPGFNSTCPSCGNTITVEQVVEQTIGQHREKVKEMIGPAKNRKRLIQWSYLAISFIVFWIMFGVFERHFAENWVLHALLSAVYLAVFLLISLWIVPRKSIAAIAYRASKIVKLGLVFNYMTGLFLLQMYLTAWWARSLMLAGLFGATWLATWLFWRMLWSILPVRDAFLGGDDTKPFDPTSPQGRNVRMD